MPQRRTGTLVSARAWAEYLGGTRIRYHWPCGATRIKDHSKGKLSKRMGPVGCELMARHWAKDRGGVIVPCPRGPGCPKHS